MAGTAEGGADEADGVAVDLDGGVAELGGGFTVAVEAVEVNEHRIVFNKSGKHGRGMGEEVKTPLRPRTGCRGGDGG